MFDNPRFWVAVAFVIFFLLFGRKLWAALSGMLDKRAADVRAELDEASRLRREAEAALRHAQAERESALADAKSLIEGARAEAARLAEAARVEAEASAKRREQMALDRIAAAEKAVVTEVRLRAADIAAEAAEQVIRGEFGPEQDAAMIDRAIAGLPGALRAA